MRNQFDITTPTYHQPVLLRWNSKKSASFRVRKFQQQDHVETKHTTTSRYAQKGTRVPSGIGLRYLYRCIRGVSWKAKSKMRAVYGGWKCTNTSKILEQLCDH